MAYPDRLDIIPSVSMLPEALPRIRLGELDAEQRFASTDGWFGEAICHLAASSVVLEAVSLLLRGQKGIKKVSKRLLELHLSLP